MPSTRTLKRFAKGTRTRLRISFEPKKAEYVWLRRETLTCFNGAVVLSGACVLLDRPFNGGVFLGRRIPKRVGAAGLHAAHEDCALVPRARPRKRQYGTPQLVHGYLARVEEMQKFSAAHDGDSEVPRLLKFYRPGIVASA